MFRFWPIAKKPLVLLLAVVLLQFPPIATGQQPSHIVIPEIIVPARTIPGHTIPGKRIPARDTPHGRIPEIVIPPIVLPDIHIPAVRTTSQRVTIPGYEPIYPSSINRYRDHIPPSSLGDDRPTWQSLARHERDSAFRRYFPFWSEELLSLFALADLDGSGSLSWREMEAFQARLYDGFRYIDIRTALTPVQFLAAGGGNCVDWSLMTVAFAFYWGWDAYVAAFFDEQSGHAIAIVRSPERPPSHYFSWQIEGVQTIDGQRIPNARYIPVDYNYVGGFSSALRAGMQLEYYMNPDRMYGARM